MPQRIAFLFQTSRYQDPDLAFLRAPGADLSALADTLRDPQIGAFDRVLVIENQRAESMRWWIEELFGWRKRYDFLFLYVSGMTLSEENGGHYLAAVDTRLADLANTAIPAEFLSGWMDRSFSRRKVLVLDCFRHRPTPAGLLPDPLRAEQSLRSFAGDGRWRAILMAAGTSYRAALTPRSAFTETVIHGLQSGDADRNQDGQIDLGELHDYLSDRLSVNPILSAHPQIDAFVITANPQSVRKKVLIKWDILAGAVLAPLLTLLLGIWSDPVNAASFAAAILLFYIGFYAVLE